MKVNDRISNKVIACIVARMNSTRLPKKSLLDVHGRPLIMRIVERLNESNTIDKIVICTSNNPDDFVLVELAKAHDNLGYIAGSELDVLSRLMDASNKYNADIVIRVTGDNPFTDSNIIDQLVENHIKSRTEYSRMVNLPIGVTPDVLSASMLPKLHSELSNPNETEYLSLFAMNRKLFKCQILQAPDHLNRPYYSLTVDTQADIDKVIDLYQRFNSDEHIPSLGQVINEMDKDYSKNCISGESPVKLPGNQIKTYDEQLKWWEGHVVASEHD